MKGIFKKTRAKLCKIAAILHGKAAQAAVSMATGRPAAILANDRGEGEVDTTTHIIRDVVLALLVLGLIYALIKTNIFPQIGTSLNNMLSYSG